MIDLAIIGAGPYGISIGAHAEKEKMNYKVFGLPMQFWKEKMPPEMFIRTLIEYTGLSDPDNQYTIKVFAEEKGITLSYPIRRTVWVDYGMWFIKKTNLDIEATHISEIKRVGNYYQLRTDQGKEYKAKHVVLAVGLTNAQYIPKQLSGFPKRLVSHSSEHTTFHKFSGKEIAVIGGGQSAWEAAGLANEAGANVHLIFRRPERLRPDKNLNAEQQKLIGKYYYLTESEKAKVEEKFSKPTVSDFLLPLIEGKVRLIPNSSIKSIERYHETKLNITTNQSLQLTVDHVIAATGYRFSIHRLDFLRHIESEIETNVFGEPIVDEYFESTLENVYFVGPSAAFSHGPPFRFISGVWHSASTIIKHISTTKYNKKMKSSFK